MVIPMLRAVPAIMLSPPAISMTLRSFILISAISRNFSRLMDPTLVLLGVAPPFSTPAAFLSRSGTGGVLVMNVNERSSWMVISGGMAMPPWWAVRWLYSLQNAIMLGPWGPSAVPIGGAGLALPAGKGSFTTAL